MSKCKNCKNCIDAKFCSAISSTNNDMLEFRERYLCKININNGYQDNLDYCNDFKSIYIMDNDDIHEGISIEDVINEPNHYKHENGLECIQEIRTVYGDLTAFAFCLGNFHKYRYRCLDKNNPKQDMDKSDKYLKMMQDIASDIGKSISEILGILIADNEDMR